MDGRQQRGMGIAAKGGLVQKGHLWAVPSQNEGPRNKTYRVNPWAAECSCPDHQSAGMRCKHLWAVEFTMTAEVRADGTTQVTRTARLTYSQDWTNYNRAQVEEKDRFMQLLAELCATVPQPPQEKGRPRLSLPDMLFATTFKVYSRFSSRRFSSDLREAQERGLIARAPHFNSVTNYMADSRITPILHELITASSLPLREVETDFAVDSSGFSTCRFEQWFDFKYGQTVSKRARRWIKAHLMVGVNTNVATAVQISAWNEADTRKFPALVEATAENFTIAEVSADKAYLSRKHAALVESFGGVPYMPFKSNTVPALPRFERMENAWERMWHQFAYNRDEWARRYHKRSNVETTFSMIKTKFGDSVLSKTPVGMENEVLCKVLAHNVVVVAQAHHELGIEPVFPDGTERPAS